jgi:hypothetical protein
MQTINEDIKPMAKWIVEKRTEQVADEGSLTAKSALSNGVTLSLQDVRDEL